MRDVCFYYLPTYLQSLGSSLFVSILPVAN